MISYVSDNFNSLVSFAKGLRNKNIDAKPVFADTPTSLKNFATKFTTLVSSMKARLTFHFLDADKELRSNNLGPDNNKSNVTITDWIVSALKDVITRVEEHGDILTVHTEALAHPQEALSLAKDDEIKALKKELDTLNDEIDETRQRGIKGNLIVSSPENSKTKTIAVHETSGGKCESDTEMIIRIIEMKTGVAIDKKDVAACHRIGKKENNAYVIRINDRKAGSAWHTITEGMMTGKLPGGGTFAKEVNLFLNFQLTKKKATLAKAVRVARKEQKIAKFYINQNGVIKIKKTNTDIYTEVKSLDHLNSMICS